MTRKALRWALQALLVGGLVVGTSVAAESAPAAPKPTLTVRRIDSTTMPLVKVDMATSGPAIPPSSFAVRENGSSVTGLRAASLAAAGTPVGTVLVVDTATSMNDNNKMVLVRAGMKSLIQAKGPNEFMAIVAYGGTARVVQDLTTDTNALSNAVDRLALGGAPGLYAGARMGATLLVDRPDLLGNLVIVGDSGNGVQSKIATAGTATADIQSSKALTFALGLKFGPTADLGALSNLASAGHGPYVEATDPASLTQAFATVRATLGNQVELTFTSRLKKGSAELVVAAQGSQATAQLVPGGIAVGEATHPPAVHVPQAPGPLRGKLGLLVVGILVLIAIGLLAYAVALLVASDETSLDTALRPYQERTGGDEEEGSGLVQSAFMQRAVATTERIAEEQGLLTKVERKLEQADLALRPAEAILFYGVGMILVAVLLFATQGPILGLIFTAIIAIIPPTTLNVLAKMRLRKFNSQLPDMLQLLSSSLRAGFSFMQGVEAVANEVENPMGSELRRVIVESRLGKPVEDALDDCARRMGSPDFDWAVMAVKIQREVGGNLAELLQTVGVTMVERERLRRDVKSLTAEGRVSGYVLGVLPPGLGLFFYVSNPTYMKPLFTNTAGQVALGVAAVCMGIGFAWMNKIVQIEV